MTSYPPRQRRNICRLHSTPTVRMRPSACKSHGKRQRYSDFQIVQVTKSECFKYSAQVPGYPSTEIVTGKTRKTSLSDPRKCDEELSPIPSIWSRKKVHPIHESVMKNSRRFRLCGPMLNASVRNTFAGRLLVQIKPEVVQFRGAARGQC
jgi:hypothetical protein